MRPAEDRAASGSEAEAAAEARRMSMLRMQLLEDHPFWGHLLLQMRLIPAPDLPSFAATDAIRRIWYNPRLTAPLELDQLGFVLLHELGHLVFESLERARGREPHRWNCATDYAINRLVGRIGWHGVPGRSRYRPPDGRHPLLGDVRSLLDPRFDGLVAEAIYERLEPSRLPAPARVAVPLGGGVTLPGVLDHGGGVDVHLPATRLAAEEEAVRDALAAALGAYREAGGRGHLPAEVVRRVAPEARGRVPWERLLARHVGEAVAAEDYALSRPNRRYQAADLLVPGLVPREAPEVVVAVDTSGSMTDEELGRVAAELAGLAALVPEVTVLVADAAIHEVVPARELPRWLRRARLRGGGGTDHRPVFDWIRARRRAPDLFVGLSDLYSRFPARRPPFPVLWVAPPEHGTPPWGRVVVMA